MTAPRVTVLMPVYNAAHYVRGAIDSIITQSFADFEFLIVDDGSTDGSAQVLQAAALSDARIRLVRNETNLGQVQSQNKGLAMARGEFVARMDADDESVAERLARQTAFMDANPRVGVCGTWVRTCGERAQAWTYPTDDSGIRCSLLFHSPLAHPSVILRRSTLAAHGLVYAETSPADDYDFWVRCAQHTRFANIPAYLLRYRLHAQQMSQRRRAQRQEMFRRIWRTQLLALGIEPGEDEFALHEVAAALGPLPDRAALARVESWLLRLAAANRASRRYPERAFAALLAEKWLRLCRVAPGGLPANLRAFAASPLARSVDGSAWAARLWQRARA